VSRPLFALRANRTDVRTEVLAGVTTFLTMAYIIFVQPAVLSTDLAGKPTGLDFGAVLVATCLVSAFSSIFMGMFARYPIALAPGMGENFFFVSVVTSLTALGIARPWQTALGIVFLSGIAFLVLTALKVREALIDAISPSMRNGIAVGIGLFIAFIGLRSGGLIVAKAGTIVGLNVQIPPADFAVFAAGLIVAGVLTVRRVRGALLWGIMAGTIVALTLGRIHVGGVFGLPSIARPAAFHMDVVNALQPAVVPFIVVFLFMGLFDTVGTLVAVAEQAGFLVDNKLPRASRALIVDATGITVGAMMGTSTVTCYIESAAGVAAGGRTGLTSVVTGLLFLVALLVSPLVAVVGSCPPITAPALVLVGAMMMQNARKIEWNEPSECIPAFLTIVGIPLSYSIADGLAVGFVAYPLIKLLSGRGREVRWLAHAIGALLVLYFVFVRNRLG
jgi:AGZA family xanthine/uracil permease-like MFS transporter